VLPQLVLRGVDRHPDYTSFRSYPDLAALTFFSVRVAFAPVLRNLTPPVDFFRFPASRCWFVITQVASAFGPGDRSVSLTARSGKGDVLPA